MSDADTIITKLRTAADWLETHELPEDVTVIIAQGPKLSLHCHTADDLKAVRRLVGPVTKNAPGVGYGMTLSGEVDGLPVNIWPPAGTCRQVQVGTERRPVVKTVETDEFEDVPVYEWDCGPVLADEPGAVA